MREIKFRAYDEKQKIMHLDFEFISSGKEHNDWIIFKSDKQQLKDKVVFDNPYFYKQFKIMQYTGSKDKNGVEIYEGDIVSTLLLNFYDKNNKLDRKTCIEKNYDFGVVEYVDYNCSFMIMRRQYKDRVTNQWNNSMELQPCRDNFEMEVIGSIYENKELLEGF